MRGLSNLIPDEMRESLNANPVVQWIVVIVMVVVGIALVVKGVNGVKDKRLTGKHGRVFEGTTAQVLGAIYAILGIVTAVAAVVVKAAA